MELSKFITICTLKDRVLEHRKVSAPAGHKHEYFKIKIQACAYSVTIFYAKFNGKISSSKYLMQDHIAQETRLTRTTFKEVVRAILPNG